MYHLTTLQYTTQEFLTSEFTAIYESILQLQKQHCPNLVQDRMDPADRHEVIIVEAESMAIVETRSGFPVPFDTASWLYVAKIFHRSQISK
jgi:hypothetical protein